MLSSNLPPSAMGAYVRHLQDLTLLRDLQATVDEINARLAASRRLLEPTRSRPSTEQSCSDFVTSETSFGVADFIDTAA